MDGGTLGDTDSRHGPHGDLLWIRFTAVLLNIEMVIANRDITLLTKMATRDYHRSGVPSPKIYSRVRLPLLSLCNRP